jgi:hypothetical protein
MDVVSIESNTNKATSIAANPYQSLTGLVALPATDSIILRILAGVRFKVMWSNKNGHWFSWMGFCYAVLCTMKSSSQDICLSRIPSATAGTFFVVKWVRMKLCTTQRTSSVLWSPLSFFEYVFVRRWKAEFRRRRALLKASQWLAWISVLLIS